MKASLSAEQQDQIATWYAQGVPVSAMAQRLGCSERTVARWRRRLGIASPITPPHRWTGDELASAEALIADGASLHEIARTLNIPYGSVQPRFRYRGWTPQQAGAWSAELHRLRRAGADL